MSEPTFAGKPIAVTERTAHGRYVVRMMTAPAKGWRQSGMHQRFDTRAEALAYVAKLAVDQGAATLNDHATAIAPTWGEW
jgi:hypothetical protein